MLYLIEIFSLMRLSNLCNDRSFRMVLYSDGSGYFERRDPDNDVKFYGFGDFENLESAVEIMRGYAKGCAVPPPEGRLVDRKRVV
jgi:hypothetical protein